MQHLPYKAIAAAQGLVDGVKMNHPYLEHPWQHVLAVIMEMKNLSNYSENLILERKRA